MTLFGWLHSLRQQGPVTAAEIRRQIAALRHQHEKTTGARDALALDAVNSDSAAEQYQRLDDAAEDLQRRIRVLAAALLTADAQDAQVAQHAAADAVATRIEEFLRVTDEARCFLDPILSQLVSGEELTRARELSLLLAREADALHRLTGDAQFRRPLDPFGILRDALVHRIERIDRARWAKSAPITLLGETPKAS